MNSAFVHSNLHWALCLHPVPCHAHVAEEMPGGDARRGSGGNIQQMRIKQHFKYPPPPLRKHGRGPSSQAKTAVQRPPRA